MGRPGCHGAASVGTLETMLGLASGAQGLVPQPCGLRGAQAPLYAAGIRKRVAVAASTDGAETLSVNRALTAIRRADVVALVVDAPECTTTGHFVATQQDFRLAELIAGEGRACVIVVNKWDAIPGGVAGVMALANAVDCCNLGSSFCAGTH